jgi:hypothetical protein
MRQAQDSEPGDPFAQWLRQTYNDLETQRRTTFAALAELDAADQTAPARPTLDDAVLLDALPHLARQLVLAKYRGAWLHGRGEFFGYGQEVAQDAGG